MKYRLEREKSQAVIYWKIKWLSFLMVPFGLGFMGSGLMTFYLSWFLVFSDEMSDMGDALVDGLMICFSLFFVVFGGLFVFLGGLMVFASFANVNLAVFNDGFFTGLRPPGYLYRGKIPVITWQEVKSVYIGEGANKYGTYKVVEIKLTNGKKRQMQRTPGTKNAVEFMAERIPDKIDPEVYKLVKDFPDWDPSMM